MFKVRLLVVILLLFSRPISTLSYLPFSSIITSIGYDLSNDRLRDEPRFLEIVTPE